MKGFAHDGWNVKMKRTPYWNYSLKRRNYEKESRIHYKIGIESKNYKIFPNYATWHLFHLLVDYQMVNWALKLQQVSQSCILVEYRGKNYNIFHKYGSFFKVNYKGKDIMTDMKTERIFQFFGIPEKNEPITTYYSSRL